MASQSQFKTAAPGFFSARRLSSNRDTASLYCLVRQQSAPCCVMVQKAPGDLSSPALSFVASAPSISSSAARVQARATRNGRKDGRSAVSSMELHVRRYPSLSPARSCTAAHSNQNSEKSAPFFLGLY